MVDVLLTASRNTLSIILGYSMSLKGWREFSTVGISHCCKMANITFTMKIWRRGGEEGRREGGKEGRRGGGEEGRRGGGENERGEQGEGEGRKRKRKRKLVTMGSLVQTLFYRCVFTFQNTTVIIDSDSQTPTAFSRERSSESLCCEGNLAHSKG